MPGLIDELAAVSPGDGDESGPGGNSLRASHSSTPRHNQSPRNFAGIKLPLMGEMSSANASGANASQRTLELGFTSEMGIQNSVSALEQVPSRPKATALQSVTVESSDPNAGRWSAVHGQSPGMTQLYEAHAQSSSRFLQESYELTRHAKSTVQWYIILKTFMSFLLALLIGAVLYAVDVDFWFVFTVMAFLLNYIPTVGGALSIMAPLIITFLGTI